MIKKLYQSIKKILNYSGIIHFKHELPNYHFKPDFFSTHSKTISLIKENSTVLDLGCNDGELIKYLNKKKNCKVTGVEKENKNNKKNIILFDLDQGLPKINYDKYDYIIMLDVIEHLNNPETFLKELYKKIKFNKKVRIILSTPNIAFFIIRLSLLFGNFNYASQGILDYTHKRLFTFSSFKFILNSAHLRVINMYGIPAPFPAVFGKNFLSFFLLKINSILIKIIKTLFSFQMVFVVKS